MHAVRLGEVLVVAVDVRGLVVKCGDQLTQRRDLVASDDLPVVIMEVKSRLHQQVDALIVGQWEALARKALQGAFTHRQVATGAVHDLGSGALHVGDKLARAGVGDVVYAVLAGEKLLLPVAAGVAFDFAHAGLG